MRQKAKFGQLSNVSELSDQLINVAELIEIIMLWVEYGQHKTILNDFLPNYERFWVEIEIEYASGVIVLVLK